ncbi:tRNA uridine-5-carboxymethylaminomethyl(34) synthesis GTPase MnmE [Acidocella aminolytica]|jgi:tRNA modification GTPase|uniref:tRNA modification GTPase MnmE n=1 Tax=Acidocella aminolytica 101 = DSM 11237 TaxID=1120923 RepID=A0A0D6PIL3_9PROT|nr:tRNA uridine-5-carboxymethylaminomethyl(34) synthesis GTPase MnmE [Acidocella aminolytica]GAN81211.1 tRNA modification GTPase TrmE/ThdF/MnmE [Acidocella aminolytica 101 = DSM 11237]GBQ31884.1 tRNA modification GTPase TrmE [Acidocella aminolytica 101 = DSM 11237]SHE85268.1 tRNA modification GTPase trmE [Acidocella aminolytica 101 = DSM 11237]
MSTIFAPITGLGGAVTTLRLSGPEAFRIARDMIGALPPPRHAGLRRLRHAGKVLDDALVIVFPGPRSFTGEDAAEISIHGGRAVLAAVSAAMVALGARPAEPGEFSRRAFETGRMDLLQAEAMADLIAAETEGQRVQALEGALHEVCAAWRETLRQIMARQEALIDFPDEDLPPEVEEKLLGEIRELRDEMQATLLAAPAAERLREGLEFVILGAPNAGKSTLMNALAGEEIAIVSDIPGTTRDAVGVRLDLGGVPVHLSDTAGLRETEDVIEAEGVRRAKVKAEKADFVILVAGPGESFPPPPRQTGVLRVRTKADLAIESGGFSVSAKTGQGMAGLRGRLVEEARSLTDRRGAASLSRPRQVACVRDTVMALDMALTLEEPELRGEELRAAGQALARLVGGIGVEEILDAVFSGFCIGK